MLWNGGDAQVLLTGREVLQRRGCCWDSVWLFFMYCDRPHSFRSIFIQSSRLTMDPRLIYFITPLRLCVCAQLSVRVQDIYFYGRADTGHRVCACFCATLMCVWSLAGEGGKDCSFARFLLPVFSSAPPAEDCSPKAANDAKLALPDLISKKLPALIVAACCAV